MSRHIAGSILRVFLLDSLLIGGLRFVLDKVAKAADAEMDDEARLRENLLDGLIADS